MLFRPSFCANCGERIERAEWYVWTSRRFCQVCESEFKGQDLIPRAIVGFGIISAVFGVGGFLRSDSVIERSITKQPGKSIDRSAPALKNTALPMQDTGVQAHSGQPEQRNLTSITATQSEPQTPLQKPKTETVDAVYYCGAATKKGAPCSRRVKGNIRCFQHTGMPAMLQPGKLRVN